MYVCVSVGEDRWLCTLLLQQGYKVEYCAAADASTYAPETFREFYNQRRRWIPSTLANMMDLMSDYHRTVMVNDNISYLYMMYQAVVMGASLLAPATVILMVAGAIHVVVGGSLYWLWLAFSIGAAVFYMLVCFRCNSDTQITVAGYMSTAYAILMLAVTVGIVVQTSQDSWTSPNAMFIIVITGIFVLAGLLHPEEFMCLMPGVLYFLCIPSGFLLLFIYAMINMNIVSWGTREVSKAEDPDKVKVKEESTWIKFVRELKRIGLTMCCCIKDRCVAFIEHKSHPPQKKDEIVKEIIAELGKMETGASKSTCVSPPSIQSMHGRVNLERHPSFESRASYERTSAYERQSNYGSIAGPGDTSESTTVGVHPVVNLLEERQRSIVRQLDSIHKDTGIGESTTSRLDYSNRSGYEMASRRISERDKYKDSESMVYGQVHKDRHTEASYDAGLPSTEPKLQRDDMVNPFWVTDHDIGAGAVRYMDQSETQFWRKLIEKYLYPIDHDKAHEAKIKRDLKTLRNNAVFLFFMLNFLWLFIIFLLQIVQDQLQDTLYIRVPKRGGIEEKHFEPLSVAFLVFFAMIILIQFVSMLFHRYGTFLHILASTGLRCCSKQYEPIGVEDIVQTVKVLQQIKGIIDDEDDEPEPDYDILGEDPAPGTSGNGGEMTTGTNPDIVSCGAESQRKPHHYSSKTLRGAFVKRYNALSKRSAKSKNQRRPGLEHVFDNAAYNDQQ